MIVVASAVEHMKSITRLVSFMLNYHYVEMNCSSIEMFLKKLRMAVRTAGCENKQVTICIKVLYCNIRSMKYTVISVRIVNRPLLFIKSHQIFAT